MSSIIENQPRGQRLLPKLIDERAERDPDRVFAAIPKSKNPSDGYHDVSYSTLAKAVDRAAWWLYDVTGKAAKGYKFAWLGPTDLRYPIFVAAAMKCRYQAGGLGACFIFPLLLDFIPVFGPPGPPTAESIEAVHRITNLDGGFYPPFMLEEMAQSSSAMETIAKLECVIFAGGPLTDMTWEKLSEVTHVHSAFGHTEGLSPAHLIMDKEDRGYSQFHPAAGLKPEHLDGDLYKAVFCRSTKEEERQTLFYVFPDVDRFETGDIYSRHPTKPDLWSYSGRADDLVVLSTGEKFNPLPAEAKINTSPLVRRSLMAGRGLPHPVLLVQRNGATTADMTLDEIITALWPTVEETNTTMATQGRLLKEYVMILPENEEFALSSKGTIQRKASEDKFAVYIKSVGSAPVSNGSAAVVETMEDAAQLVKEVLASLCGFHEVDDDRDLFELGLDSAQAAQVSGRLREVANAWPRDLGKGIAYFYKNPTVRGLAGKLLSPANNGTKSFDGTNSVESDAVDDGLSMLVHKYTSGLEARERRPRRSDALTVILTGSTGNIGSHLLNRLIDDPLVNRIFCLNRATTGEAAQRDAYKRHRLQPRSPGKKTVQYFSVDLSQPLLGLSPADYESLQQEADLVLHNAWELNFTRPVELFEKTHIAGTRHLIDLCAGSRYDARMVFLSSIGAVNGQKDCDTLITEEAASRDHKPADQGYSQSKAVAERVLLEACARGTVAGNIIRLGQIAGASGDEEGYWSTTDWAPRILVTSKVLGLVPRSLGPMSVVDWVPINEVPDILMDIVHTSTGSSTTGSDCPVHHIANPRRVAWEDIAPTAREHLGEKARLVNFHEWLDHLTKAASGGEIDREKLPAMALLGWLETLSSPEVTPRYLSVEKTQAISLTLAGLEPVNGDMLRRWMREWGL
ncbi:male sterility protein [Sarocladium implicatum]|nr:male sterility protein [Sarocladium implicatum]